LEIFFVVFPCVQSFSDISLFLARHLRCRSLAASLLRLCLSSGLNLDATMIAFPNEGSKSQAYSVNFCVSKIVYVD
jgi:hypothetical protein